AAAGLRVRRRQAVLAGAGARHRHRALRRRRPSTRANAAPLLALVVRRAALLDHVREPRPVLQRCRARARRRRGPAALRTIVLWRARVAAAADGRGHGLRPRLGDRGVAAPRLAAAPRCVSLLGAAARSGAVGAERPQMSRARRSVFETPWFAVVEQAQAAGDPYYMLELPDYVSVIAVTPAREILLVRQHRPVVDRETLELPSGHVEPGEKPEAAARRELLEETGYVADDLELLAELTPDVGRLANRMWCFFAGRVRPADRPHERERGVHVVAIAEHEVLRAAADGTIDHALNLAPLFLAVAHGKLSLRPEP